MEKIGIDYMNTLMKQIHFGKIMKGDNYEKCKNYI